MEQEHGRNSVSDRRGGINHAQASTKDGELVVRPKLTLGDSTNVGDLREFNTYRRSIVRGA